MLPGCMPILFYIPSFNCEWNTLLLSEAITTLSSVPVTVICFFPYTAGTVLAIYTSLSCNIISSFKYYLCQHSVLVTIYKEERTEKGKMHPSTSYSFSAPVPCIWTNNNCSELFVIISLHFSLMFWTCVHSVSITTIPSMQDTSVDLSLPLSHFTLWCSHFRLPFKPRNVRKYHYLLFPVILTCLLEPASLFLDRVLCSLGWAQTHYVAECSL